VHALVRGTESLLPRPVAPGRALKGEPARGPAHAPAPAVPRWRPRPHNAVPLCSVGVYRGPRVSLDASTVRAVRAYLWVGGRRPGDARTLGRIARYL
jgi:hypothetical protein